MLVFGVLHDLGGDLAPRVHVTVQVPLLLVHEGLDVDATALARVLQQLHLGLALVTSHCDCQILVTSTMQIQDLDDCL